MLASTFSTLLGWLAGEEYHSIRHIDPVRSSPRAFVALALAIAAIAVNEARSGPITTPVWASWLGAVAGVLAIGGFVLALGLGIALGGPVWLVSSILMSLWTLWFGVNLARSGTVAESAPAESGPDETVS